MELSEDWKGIEDIVIYGLGSVADRVIDKLIDDFNVIYIIDKNKKGQTYRDIPIIAYDDAFDEIRRKKIKIIVTTAQRTYDGIKKILTVNGFMEGIDFIRVEQFAVEWYWENRQQINIIQVNTAVTTFCTLNCTNCNMFMPYYKERKIYDFYELKTDMDLLMQYVDYVFCYSFLGGEPFLNKELYKIIDYAGTKYKEKIGRLAITTNGTVIPDDKTMEVLRKNNVHINVSDYTNSVDYKDKFEDFLMALKKNKIEVSTIKSLVWKKFGFPNESYDWGDSAHTKCHMLSCAPLFHGLNDGRFYYCHVVWSANKAGLYDIPKEDYIQLNALDKDSLSDRRKLSEYSRGVSDKGYLSFCRRCGGCGNDNTDIVIAGEQKYISG